MYYSYFLMTTKSFKPATQRTWKEVLATMEDLNAKLDHVIFCLGDREINQSEMDVIVASPRGRQPRNPGF